MAYWLIRNSNEVPNKWKYDPSYKFKFERTTAMLLANEGIIPPKEWIHNPNIGDLWKNTVASHLKRK